MVRRIMIEIIITVLVVVLSYFGWRPTRRYQPVLSQQQRESAQRLRDTVRYLADDIGIRNYSYYANLQRTADYITGSFEELGYEVEAIPYSIEDKVFNNIVANLRGRDSSKATVIIGAHYDSCFNPGADDNASGIAVLLELARLLRDKDLESSIRFIAFVNEEPPFFRTEEMGSHIYVEALKDKADEIKAAIIFESVGYYSQEIFSQRYLPFMGPFYPNRANFIGIVGNLKSRRLVGKLYSGFRSSSDFPVEKVSLPSFIPAVDFSDHRSFWEAGIPAVMITDTAFLRNSSYHSQNDLPYTLDYDMMTGMLYGIKDAILKIAQD